MQLCASYCLTMDKDDKIADISLIFYQITEDK